LCADLGGVALAAVGNDVPVVVAEPPAPLSGGVLVHLEGRLASGGVRVDVHLPFPFRPLHLEFEFDRLLLAFDLDLHLELLRWIDGHRLVLIDRNGVAVFECVGDAPEVRRDCPSTLRGL
jgi:hypothetical protein